MTFATVLSRQAVDHNEESECSSLETSMITMVIMIMKAVNTFQLFVPNSIIFIRYRLEGKRNTYWYLRRSYSNLFLQWTQCSEEDKKEKKSEAIRLMHKKYPCTIFYIKAKGMKWIFSACVKRSLVEVSCCGKCYRIYFFVFFPSVAVSLFFSFQCCIHLSWSIFAL